MSLQNLGGGGQDALQNYIFNLGGQCPPALPVANPMSYITFHCAFHNFKTTNI